MSYGTRVSELTGVDGEYWITKLADAIACGSVTYIMDDTEPGEPVRVFVRDFAPALQERIWAEYDAINEAIEKLNREEETLSSEYGAPMRLPKQDGPPAWARPKQVAALADLADVDDLCGRRASLRGRTHHPSTRGFRNRRSGRISR